MKKRFLNGVVFVIVVLLCGAVSTYLGALPQGNSKVEGTLTVNIVTEDTTDSGVSIETANFKDGAVTSATIDADLNTITNIENADIKAGAAVDATKIANGTVTSTEFQYIDATSSIQTQLNAKLASPIESGYVVDSMMSTGIDAAKIADGSVSNAEYQYNDATSSIQTQLDVKSTASKVETLTDKTIDADSNTVYNLSDGSIKVGAAINSAKIGSGTVSNTEFSYVNGVTSAIQTQMDTKITTSSTDTLTNKTMTAPVINSPTGIAIGDMSDVTETTPAVDQVLTYTGAGWENRPAGATGVGGGIIFYMDDDNILPADSENTYKVNTLLEIPDTVTAEDVDTISCASNTVCYGSYLYNTALGGTSIDAGIWEFNTYASVSSVGGGRESSLTRSVFHVVVESETVTTTGSGTSRTCTASGGVYVAGDANADITLAGYVQTPKGLYQITAYSSATVCTILTPTGYGNESGVATSTWKNKFQVSTGAITNLTTNYGLYSTITFQAEITIASTDKLAEMVFGVSDNTTNVNFCHNGTEHYSHFHTPMSLRHNDLAGLYGDSPYYHLSTANNSALTTSTQGDIFYSSATNTISKLGKGTSGQVFVQGASIPAWGSQIGNLDIVGDLAVGDGTDTPLSVDSDSVDISEKIEILESIPVDLVGDISVRDSGDSIIFYIDESSQYVGIGDVPSNLLHVKADDGVSTDYYVAKFENNETDDGKSYGLSIKAGSTSGDVALMIRDHDDANTLFTVFGDGDVTILKDLAITGALSKGSGTFTIDHPLDPENKLLQHSFVESPEMRNVYYGQVDLVGGKATITLPDWWMVLNGTDKSEYNYQLTCIGGYTQTWISKEVKNGTFEISGIDDLKVSWQLSAIRHDEYAENNRIQVEVDKETPVVGDGKIMNRHKAKGMYRLPCTEAQKLKNKETEIAKLKEE